MWVFYLSSQKRLSNITYSLLSQEHRESKKRLEEIVDELKKELSAAEHQLQKNTMEIKVLAYLIVNHACTVQLNCQLVSKYSAIYLPPMETCIMELSCCLVLWPDHVYQRHRLPSVDQYPQLIPLIDTLIGSLLTSLSILGRHSIGS